MKCPYCHFENEDGVLFCEQCKSDLGVLESTALPGPADAEAPIAVPAIPISAEPLDDILVANLAAPEAAFAVGDAAPAPDTSPPATETLDDRPPAVEAEAPLAPESVPLAAPAPVPAAAAVAPAKSVPAVTASAPPPRLVVTRGQKINEEFPLFEGENFIGRADEKPVDIDLEHQEHPERVWSSRQHAVITLEQGLMTIEDLNSSNGTFVNRSRIATGDKYPLSPGDVIQVGTVQLKVKA